MKWKKEHKMATMNALPHHHGMGPPHQFQHMAALAAAHGHHPHHLGHLGDMKGWGMGLPCSDYNFAAAAAALQQAHQQQQQQQQQYDEFMPQQQQNF